MSNFAQILGTIVSLKFSSHEEMMQAAIFWNLEEYQLESGLFEGSVDAIHTKHIQIAYVVHSKGIFAKGTIPDNTYVFTSVESEGKITHNGLTVDDDEVILLTEDDEIDFVVSSSREEVTMAIDKTFFNIEFETYFNEPFHHDDINKRVQLKQKRGPDFRNSLNQILIELIKESERLKNDSNYCNEMEQKILSIIFESIDRSKKRQKTLDSVVDANQLRKCLENDYNKNINFKAICISNKLADRTVRSGFKKLFGLSPKKYHTQYKLGKVHHDLIKSDNKCESVKNIASKHGFDHMGRFSQNYKKMFLKTPSQTLRDSLPY